MFVCVDHWSAEAWTHVAKIGDRIAALQPIQGAVIDRFGRLGPDVARGIKLRHDWGPQAGFNWSLQHLECGGVDGQACWVDAGVDGALTDEVARGAVSSA